MLNKLKVTFFITFLLFKPYSFSLAGSGYELKCQNPVCAYQSNVDIGGGFIFEEISGYCERCQQFVSIRWQRSNDYGDYPELPSRDLPAAPPEALGTARSPITGEMASTYPCPRCSGPFTEIRSIPEDEMLYCPKCTLKTLKAEHTMFYD